MGLDALAAVIKVANLATSRIEAFSPIRLAGATGNSGSRLSDTERAAASANASDSRRIGTATRAAFDAARLEGYEGGRRAGHEEGYERGYNEGRELGQGEYGTQLAALREIGARLAEPRSPLEDCRVAEVLSFALAVAEKVVRTEVTQNPGCIAASISDCLSRCRGAVSVSLRVHPDDVDVARAASEDARVALGFDDCSLVADLSISRGGCIVETPSGVVDARVETQLREIARELLMDCPEVEDVIV